MATFTAEEIDQARQQFMNTFISKNGGKRAFKYIGEVQEQDLPQDSIDFYKSKTKGDESCIELHLFEITRGQRKGVQVIAQWRLRPSDDDTCRMVATLKQ
jgi:hypothetical protein